TYRRAVTQQEPHFVTIMGDPGVGKTRLVRELWGWLSSESPHSLQRTGRWLPDGQITYWPIGEVVKEHLAIREDDPPERVRELLAVRVSEAVREPIVERAEGNPCFVEELVAALAERGDFQLPDSVQALLAARIDLLPPVEKGSLQAAAVIGRIFWTGPVRELLGGEEPDWALLEDRDFVRRRPGSSISGETEYAIKHALTREVAYGTLPKAKRARLHAALAEWLERFGEGRDEHAALLAHHYAEAVRPEDEDLAWAGA